jgi:flagellar protein FlaJ
MNEDKKIEDDMLFMLTYTAAIATGDIDRGQIFKFASEQKEYLVSIYFKRVYSLAVKLGYEYAKACKSISNKVKFAVLKEFLGRMANAMASGEPEKDFLRNELATMENIYSNKYERDIEALKKWTDGYTALLISTTLIVMVLLLSTMLYPIGNIHTMAYMTGFLLFFICAAGILFTYQAAPYDKLVHSLKNGSKEQKIIRRLTLILLPSGIISTGVLFYLGIDAGYILMTAAVFIAPIGVMGLVNDHKINKRDAAFPSFIKTLGSLAGTMGTTTDYAVKNMDRETVGFLEPLVNKLHVSMSMNLKSSIIWEKFIRDSGSEMINRFTRIFNDAVNLGGNPAKVGSIVSSSSLAIVLLRMKRKTVSSSFMGLIIVLHAAMAGLLVFIIEILNAFSKILTVMMADSFLSDGQDMISETSGMGLNILGSTGASDLAFLYNFTIVTVIILTLANSTVMKVADGGGNYKFFFYGAIISAVSGLVLIVVPIITSGIFSSVV